MARSGRGNTFDFVAKVFYALCLLSLVVCVLYASKQNVWAAWWLAASVSCLISGIFFHGMSDIVHHLMSISQNTRETARKLQEMSVPRDSENPPLP